MLGAVLQTEPMGTPPERQEKHWDVEKKQVCGHADGKIAK
jgi:hypothetical protein